MPQNDNDRLRFLLETDLQELLSSVQNTVQIVIKYFIKTRLFTLDEYNDIVQKVNEELWMRLPIIQKQFDGTVLVRTYLAVVIRNICLKISSEKSLDTLLPFQNFDERVEEQVSDILALDDERKRFEHILRQFHREENKVLLCLKLLLRLPIAERDLKLCFPFLKQRTVKELSAFYRDQLYSMSDNEIFVPVVQHFLKSENAAYTADSLRKWSDRRLQSIITRMNGNPPKRFYTRKTLQQLFEYFISKNNEGT